MNFRSSLGLLTGLIISYTIVTIPETIAAPQNKYFCAVLDGVPRTFVNTSRGNAIMINWVNQLGSKAPRERCIEVSKRFQRFYDNRTLRQIVTGVVNNQPVLCAVRDQNSFCNQTNVLVTLPPGIDRYQAAQKLLNLRAWASGAGTINLSTDETIETYINGESYYDLAVIEKVAPTVTQSFTTIGEK